jgi:AbrB family looped-hinge helix DNA binding protein
MLTHMSTKGQVVIPVEVRQALKLKAATAFQIEVHGEVIHLKPVRREWQSLEGILSGGTSLTRALEAERAAEIDAEDRR